MFFSSRSQTDETMWIFNLTGLLRLVMPSGYEKKKFFLHYFLRVINSITWVWSFLLKSRASIFNQELFSSVKSFYDPMNKRNYCYKWSFSSCHYSGFSASKSIQDLDEMLVKTAPQIIILNKNWRIHFNWFEQILDLNWIRGLKEWQLR